MGGVACTTEPAGKVILAARPQSGLAVGTGAKGGVRRSKNPPAAGTGGKGGAGYFA